MLVLGVETSCDDTAIGIYDSKRGLIGHAVHSQIDTHAKYGGVVPELASRDHISKILPLLAQTLKSTNTNKNDLTGIAYTKGPGLIGSLMVGATVAASLGYALDIPTIGVHHLEAHILAVMLEANKPEYPFLALLVSGGHTLLIKVANFGEYKILGESIDDAVGEAFDKTAKMLGLPYPGGPALAALAEKGDPIRFSFPRPMINQANLNFSFSGLKTAVLQCFQKNKYNEQIRADIASSFQQAVIDTLAIKCKRAVAQTGLKTLVVVGGVGANIKLRERLTNDMQQINGKIFFPRREFCTDNGAMVAYTGYEHLLRNNFKHLAIEVKSRLELENRS